MKKFGICCGILLVLFTIIILLLPTFLSTAPGKKIVLNMLEGKVGMSLEAEDLSLSWFGPQRAKGVLGKRADMSFFCREIQTDASLFSLMLKKDLGQLQILGPQMEMHKPLHTAQYYQKPQILQSGIGIPKITLGMTHRDIDVTGHIVVEEGKLSFATPGLDPIYFDQLQASVDLQQNNAALALSCQTRQQSKEGQIAIEGSAAHIHSDFPQIALQCSLSQIPVRALDQITSLFFPDLNGALSASLGEILTLQCNLQLESGNMDLNLVADAQEMHAEIATQTTNGILSLKNPGVIYFNVSPQLLSQIVKNPSLTLRQTIPMRIDITAFSCPIPTQISDLSRASFQANVTTATVVPFSLSDQALELNNLKIALHSKDIEKQIGLYLTAALLTGNRIGSIALDGQWDKPLSGQMQGSMNVNASQFPVAILAGGSPLLVQILGPMADFNGSIEMRSANPKLQLNWKSDYLSLSNLSISLKNPYSLISPATFSYAINPELLPNGIKIQGLQGTLNNLVVPEDNIQKTNMELVLVTGPINIEKSGNTMPMQVGKLNCQLSIHTLNQMTLSVDSEVLQGVVVAGFNPNGQELTLLKPMSLQLKLDNPLWQWMLPQAPELKAPCIVKLTLEPSTFPLKDMTKVNMAGQLASAQMVLGAQNQSITLQNLLLPFKWNAKTQNASLQLSAQIQGLSQKAGLVQGQGELSNFAKGLNFATWKGSFDVQNLSSSILELVGQPILAALSGSTFSSQMKIESTPSTQNVAVKWTSPTLNAEGAFLVSSSGVQLQGPPSQVTWTLTPENYPLIDRMLIGPTKTLPPFEIKESSTFNFSLTKLFLPVQPLNTGSLMDRIPHVVWDFQKLQLSGAGRNASLKFFDQASKESIQLSSMTWGLNKNEGPLSVNMDTNVATQNEGMPVKNGLVSLKGTWDPKSTWDWSQLRSSLQMKVQQFPSRALDLIARAKGRKDFPFTTLFGEMINASLMWDVKDFNGPISLNVNTPRLRTELNGQLVAGALMLHDALNTQIKITPEMSRLVLKEINPLNLSYLYSQAPVTIDIPANGFYFPIYPFNLGKIAIPKATIELGKIACRNEGNVNITLGLLKTKQFDQSNELLLWFAPIVLKVQKGIADIERTEILLADTFDICTWGNVDLIQDYVDMTLGLTAQTLAKAFGIKGLPENYVLLIPMKGPSDNVQINTGKATAKVALLLAWQNKNVAGPAGAIVGDLLGKIGALPDAKAKVPPAKHPFPWEMGKEPKVKKATHEKKRQFKTNEKPLKQIFKVIRK